MAEIIPHGNQPTPAPRVQTGVPGLDEVMSGGLVSGRTVLIKGEPGSGKTTLGLQILVAGARQFGEAGVMIAFEQTPAQILSDMAAFGWDLQELTDQRMLHVLCVSPEEILSDPKRQANRLLVNIADLVDEYGARRVLIDSVSHLAAHFGKENERAQFLAFLNELKRMRLTPIMTAELRADEGIAGVEAYLVDTLILLERRASRLGIRELRTLQVVKSRGCPHLGGEHPFELNAQGVAVFPHSFPDEIEYEIDEAEDDETEGVQDVHGLAAKIPTGVPGLDGLIGGGYGEGSVIMVAGLSGTFKTNVAAHFLLGGGADAAPGLWLTFQEGAADLELRFGGHGLNFPGGRSKERLTVLEAIPGREPVEKLLALVEEAILDHGVDLVAIDSLNDLVAAMPDEEARFEAADWFLRRLRALRVTVLVTQRLTRVTGRNPLSEIAWAQLADTIVYLGLVEIESRLEKVVSVLKHRGAAVPGDLRAIVRDESGLRVHDRFVGMSGVLQGTPLGRRKARIEEIFQPLYFIRDFLTLAREQQIDEAQRNTALQNVAGETSRLIELLSQYFDQPTPDGKERAKDTPS